MPLLVEGKGQRMPLAEEGTGKIFGRRGIMKLRIQKAELGLLIASRQYRLVELPP
jgi:hypothetical protein